jgi:hypothetical protein
MIEQHYTVMHPFMFDLCAIGYHPKTYVAWHFITSGYHPVGLDRL